MTLGTDPYSALLLWFAPGEKRAFASSLLDERPARNGDNTKRNKTEIKKVMMRKEYDFSGTQRGPVIQVPKGKTRITIRLDDDILRWFKDQVHAAGGGNYQTLINQALREYIEGKVSAESEPLEETLRRVIREELQSA